MLPVREDRLDRERYLFYICASRAERLLVLSSRSSDEEGNPQTESYFVDDVRELLTGDAEIRTRSLSEVTWRPDDAPTSAEWDRALAATGPRRPVPRAEPLSSEPLLAELSARDAVAARALENFADCPVKWLVEDLLKPEELVPDPEAMVRGSYAHEVLRRTYERLADETGSRRVTHDNLPDAERILLDELRDKSSMFQLSPEADARARRRAPAGVRPAALPALGGRLRLVLRAGRARARLRPRRGTSRSSSRAACACAAGSTASTSATAWRS